MFKTNFSGHNKILGVTAPEWSPWLRIWAPKIFGNQLPQIA